MLGTVSWKEMMVIVLVVFFGVPLFCQLVEIFTPKKVKEERQRKRNSKMGKWKAKQERKIRIFLIVLFTLIAVVYYGISYVTTYITN